jgi:ketosteroid isomerase-like protein
MSTADNVAAVRAVYEAYARGDASAAFKLLSEDVEIFGPTGTGPFRTLSWDGHEGFVAFISQIQEEWSHESYQAVSVEGAGDWVVSLIRVVTQNKRSKKRLETTMAHALRFQDGKCVEFHEHVERDAMAATATP